MDVPGDSESSGHMNGLVVSSPALFIQNQGILNTNCVVKHSQDRSDVKYSSGLFKPLLSGSPMNNLPTRGPILQPLNPVLTSL